MRSHTVEAVQQQNMLKTPSFASSLNGINISRTTETGTQYGIPHTTHAIFSRELFAACRVYAAFFHVSNLGTALSESHLKGQVIQILIFLSKSELLINSFSNLAILTLQPL